MNRARLRLRLRLRVWSWWYLGGRRRRDHTGPTPWQCPVCRREIAAVGVAMALLIAVLALSGW